MVIRFWPPCFFPRKWGGGGGARHPSPPPGSAPGPNTSDTQRDEWLLKTEPLQGAHPKWSDLRWLMTGRGFWTWKPLGVWGSECGATWKYGPSAATRAADLTGGRGDYTAEGGGELREPSGSRASSTTRRATSSASDFYGRPIKGRRFRPTE